MACMAVAATRLGLGLWGARTMQARGYNLNYPCQFSSNPVDDVGSSGSIREAGGAFSKREKAEEDRYFREKSREQLASLKKHHQEEIMHHEKEIERLQKEIERHKNKMKKLKQDKD